MGAEILNALGHISSLGDLWEWFMWMPFVWKIPVSIIAFGFLYAVWLIISIPFR